MVNRLSVVFDEVERLNLRSVLMRNAGQQALADQIPMLLGSDGVVLKPADQTTIDDMRCLARDVADMVRRSDLSVEAKAYWLSMWVEVARMTSRLITLFERVTPDVLDAMAIPAGVLGDGFNTHPEHLDIAVLSAELRAFYYSVEKAARGALLREFPAINEPGGWGRGLRRGSDNHGIIEPYMGTPVLTGARSA